MNSTQLAQPGPDRVDPCEVPSCLLSDGTRMPAIGLGTFGSDHVSADAVAEAVVGAAEVGYRHFDCAAVYGNEGEIGRALEQVMAGGVSRSDLWITSKLWNDRHGEADVVPACLQTLSDLRLDYLDLYLVHWPFPNWHAPGCDVTARYPNARPYIHENYMRTWRQLEKLVELGLVRAIGTSNMTIPKLELLLRDACIKPVVNQLELHPHFQQPELFQYLGEHDIQPVGFSPLGSPRRPPRDRTPEDTSPLDDPVIAEIAARRGVPPASICIRWAVQRGQIPIPFSTSRSNYLANLRAAVAAPLTAGELEAIRGIDRNCRLVKGQVFLWKEGQSWEDLWDVNGEVTPP